MTTITLPPEVEKPLADEARKLGTTPERLALESLRRLFAPFAVPVRANDAETLFDFLNGYIGAVSGTTEALSEECGRRFAEGLTEDQQRSST